MCRVLSSLLETIHSVVSDPQLCNQSDAEIGCSHHHKLEQKSLFCPKLQNTIIV